MRKEALFAIFLGSVIGLAIAFGLMRANKALVPAKQVEATQSPTQNPSLQTEEKVAAGALLVVKPQNNAIVPTSKVSVEGSSTPNSTVVIATNGSEAVLQTSKNGEFTSQVELSGGPNQIKVISFDNNGNESSTSLTVVYSTELQ
ncbi:MAG: hypothetical protein A2782_01460 [Candidatus Blackburnbacteria bacterium RIFCSPHIGHO2_01_FULL_43_15b]|uniref:Bacterial Ig domain-containing protein n=1 Tax=Candidatus Blackburnbacteria bacterium RIFCSPHIGHO2_01_FULL_43_15b TaxID=1797513 RepID=A0A1G1UXG7_9BACT|nr:MAG: hypothetical protein A2782_01460 [Candidatus Blackburnbacteria bacterium RIFCSPHIGHO2_01_FULL_43_15b]